MNLTFSDEQMAIADLAMRCVFDGELSVERLARAETSSRAMDPELWITLAESGLTGVGLPESYGGTGGGLVELCCLLEQQGRALAPLPLARTLVAAHTIAACGTAGQRDDWLKRVVDGNAILTVVADPTGRVASIGAVLRRGVWELEGHAIAVPGFFGCHAALVVADTSDGARVFVVDAATEGIASEPARTTNQFVHANLRLEGACGEPLSIDATDVLTTRLRVALAAIALGVAEEALARAATYVSERHQFGKPLSGFQSTAHRAADSSIDAEAMRWTLWQAASLLDQQTEPGAVRAALVAAWWAADAVPRVVQSVQHMHGGVGADLDYPIHRYYLWGTQLEIELGGASALLAELGADIAGTSVGRAEGCA